MAERSSPTRRTCERAARTCGRNYARVVASRGEVKVVKTTVPRGHSGAPLPAPLGAPRTTPTCPQSRRQAPAPAPECLQCGPVSRPSGPVSLSAESLPTWPKQRPPRHKSCSAVPYSCQSALSPRPTAKLGWGRCAPKCRARAGCAVTSRTRARLSVPPQATRPVGAGLLRPSHSWRPAAHHKGAICHVSQRQPDNREMGGSVDSSSRLTDDT